MSDENVETLRAAKEAWNAGDMPAFRELHAPDVILRTLEEWPEPGPHVGRDTVMRFFGQIREAWDADELEWISEPVHAADRVVVRFTWHGEGHGPRADMEMTCIHTVRNGRIRGYEYFWDHTEALEALGLQKREMPSERAEGCVRQIFEGANNRDAAAIQSACDPAFELTSRFSAVEGATYRGHAGIVDYLADLETAWEDIRWTLEDLIPAGEEKLIVVAHTQGIARGSGVPIDERAYSTWELRQGKALRAHVYTSRDEALEAVGLSGIDNLTDPS